VAQSITPSPFDQLVGTELLEIGPEEARARIKLEDRHTQPHGLAHGGVFATLAESVCSTATAEAVAPDGRIALGLSNTTTFLRPIGRGYVNAHARRRHGGRTTWVWDVEISDDEGRICALVRMTIAIREAPKT
jgi:1,4-dihydroxy-2-naphthoyl-CoA hydrolase